MERTIKRHDAGEARVIPVRLRPVDCEGTAFEKLQYLPSGDLPMTSWSNQDAALLEVAREIRKAVMEQRLRRCHPRQVSPPIRLR